MKQIVRDPIGIERQRARMDADQKVRPDRADIHQTLTQLVVVEHQRFAAAEDDFLNRGRVGDVGEGGAPMIAVEGGFVRLVLIVRRASQTELAVGVADVGHPEE